MATAQRGWCPTTTALTKSPLTCYVRVTVYAAQPAKLPGRLGRGRKGSKTNEPKTATRRQWRSHAEEATTMPGRMAYTVMNRATAPDRNFSGQGGLYIAVERVTRAGGGAASTSVGRPRARFMERPSALRRSCTWSARNVRQAGAVRHRDHDRVRFPCQRE